MALRILLLKSQLLTSVLIRVSDEVSPSSSTPDTSINHAFLAILTQRMALHAVLINALASEVSLVKIFGSDRLGISELKIIYGWVMGQLRTAL